MTPNLYDLNSADGVRQIVAALFQGYNYRLYTEGQTRNQLLDAYRQLTAVRERLPADASHEEWMAAAEAELDDAGNDLAWWLLGLTNKTAQNLGIRRDGRLDYLEEVARHVREVSAGSPDGSFDDGMLMLWAGAATLTIRGSRKSTAGKTLERAFLRAGLTILGLEEGTDFWLNMQRDAEVPREIDVEIASRRGRIRVEMGLIERGNQEVIEDKITRVGTGGMVIFDQIGPRSNARQTAENNQVGFIQIRNNRPLTEMHGFLNDKVAKMLVEPPANTDDIVEAVGRLPDELFVSGLLPA
ncbi:MAG: CfrBI family restriction endonuclease [Chloroflexi bacterium]|nr:CfrBI family restriction endonuclease [Chloroflexota bacterium]